MRIYLVCFLLLISCIQIAYAEHPLTGFWVKDVAKADTPKACLDSYVKIGSDGVYTLKSGDYRVLSPYALSKISNNVYSLKLLEVDSNGLPNCQGKSTQKITVNYPLNYRLEREGKKITLRPIIKGSMLDIRLKRPDKNTLLALSANNKNASAKLKDFSDEVVKNYLEKYFNKEVEDLVIKKSSEASSAKVLLLFKKVDSIRYLNLNKEGEVTTVFLKNFSENKDFVGYDSFMESSVFPKIDPSNQDYYDYPFNVDILGFEDIADDSKIVLRLSFLSGNSVDEYGLFFFNQNGEFEYSFHVYVDSCTSRMTGVHITPQIKQFGPLVKTEAYQKKIQSFVDFWYGGFEGKVCK